MRQRHGRHVDPAQDRTTPGHLLGLVLTLAVLPPAAALLLARLRTGLELQSGSAVSCSGADLWGPVLLVGVPVVLVPLAVVAALLSISRRAVGWVWVLLALVTSGLAQLAVQTWLPGCLP